MVKHATREPLHVNVRPNQVGGSFQLAGLGSGDWGLGTGVWGLGSGLACCHWEAALTAREASRRKQAGKWQDLTPAILG